MGDKTRTGAFRTLFLLLFMFALCLFTQSDASAKSPPWQPPGSPPAPTCPKPGDTPPSLFPPDLAQTETVSAGTLGGSFSVSTSGDGNYTLPLVVPPGRAGMEPSLALTYDSSSAGDGVLGMGFSISGLAIDYGSSPGSKALANTGAVHAWWVTKSSDRNGNSILYSYLNDEDPTHTYTTEIVPAKIQYTDHPSAPASRAVVFDYATKPFDGIRTIYAHGMALQRSRLLTRVRMLGPYDGLVREYRFSYLPGNDTGRLLLTNVRECAADQVCKPQTTFGWNLPAPGFTAIATPIAVPHSPWAAVMPMDVTGDGLDDLVIPDVLVV